MNRTPFTYKNDERLEYLVNVVTSFKSMDNSERGNRIKGLTKDTSEALHITLFGVVDAIKMLLDKGMEYVLSGIFQSDRLEGEVRIYRQLGAGNVHISVQRVING